MLSDNENIKSSSWSRRTDNYRPCKNWQVFLDGCAGLLADIAQVSSIEFTQIQATVMKGLEMGNEVLTQLHKEMSLEKVERLMDQTKEGVAYQRVSTASSGAIDKGYEADLV